MLHYFNPGHETAVLNASPYYVPPKNQLKMQSDLAYLPAWYAAPNDLVWISHAIFPDSFMDFITKTFPKLARPLFQEQFVNEKEMYIDEEVVLWGISKHSINFFEKFIKLHFLNIKLPEYHNELLMLNNRLISKEFLDLIIPEISDFNPEITPQFFTDMTELLSVIGQSTGDIILKSPYSSSGKGLLWINDRKVGLSKKQQISGILKKQQSISLEKALDKKLDFAMQFFIEKNGEVNFVGYSLFETNCNGKYEENIIASQTEIEARILTFVSEKLLEKTKSLLIDFIQTRFFPYCTGCVGVDMLIYRENDGFHLHPCVEINTRYTMGYLALKIHEQFIAEQAKGIFRIDYSSVRNTLFNNHISMEKDYPLICSGDQKVVSGYFPLCPVTTDSSYHAYVVIVGLS